MAIMMNMSSYVVEEMSSTVGEYRDEAMRAAISLQIAMQHHQATLVEREKAFPTSLATVDIDMFLQEMSAYRS